MKNKGLFRLVTFFAVLLGLALLLGGSFAPAIEIKASSTTTFNGIEIFLSSFGLSFYMIFVTILLIAGLFVGLYFENKTASALGGGVALASSLGLLYAVISFEVERRKAFKQSAAAGATFQVDVGFFLLLIGIAILVILSILAIVLALLPEPKEAEEKPEEIPSEETKPEETEAPSEKAEAAKPTDDKAA
jgi:Na+-transporting methylmalonyl-CoA/oxaloacetate decarboxylase gamma subunit